MIKHWQHDNSKSIEENYEELQKHYNFLLEENHKLTIRNHELYKDLSGYYDMISED